MQNVPKTGMTARFTSYEIARFWQKVKIAGPDECWEWQASTREGYGVFRAQGENHAAHRVAWELVNGPFPDELIGRHSCDNRRCCNPAHVIPGTQLENVQDMVARGRQAVGLMHGTHTHPESLHRGSAHKDARLTEAQVIHIRRRAAMGVTMKALAREYGVSNTSIKKIILRRTWVHVFDDQDVALAEAA